LADRLVGRKIADGRVLLAGITFIGAAVVFLPGLAVSSLLVAVPFFLIAVVFVSAPSAPLPAACFRVSRLCCSATSRHCWEDLTQTLAPG
jgi:hypothetical protein